MYYSCVYKIALVISIVAVMPIFLKADLIYDPVTNCAYTSPASPEINVTEYWALFISCAQIEKNMIIQNGGICPPKKVVLQQVSRYLKSIGTKTALRLLADLEKDKMYYPDGSVARTIFS